MSVRRQPSHFTALLRHQDMNVLEKVVHTVRELDAAKAVHTALLGTEARCEAPMAWASLFSRAGHLGSPRYLDPDGRHVRRPDRHDGLGDVRPVAAP